MCDISVILPVYNGGYYLSQSIESVLNQENADFELIIVDDNSSDHSKEYLKLLKDKRVSVFYNKTNKGLFWNLNFLIKKTKSPLIKLWAQDDIMYPECLHNLISFHNKYPQVGFSYCKVHYINELGERTRPEWDDPTPELISSDLHARISFEYGCIAGNISNTCITRKALDKVGYFNEYMRISADFEMWVRIAQYFLVGFLKKHLIQLRDHTNQLSRDKKYYIDHVKEDLQVYEILLSYVTPDTKKWGEKMLQKNKYVFYYTLMLKTFITGNIQLTRNYFSLLYKHANIFILTFNFFKKKLIKI